MQINCPRCATTVEVSAEQIMDAAGMTHCVRCHHVFEVHEHPLDLLNPGNAPDPLPEGSIASPPRRNNSAWWFLATLALLLLLASQLAWYYQDALLRHPQFRMLAEGVCIQLDCRLPPLRDPQQIQVLKREVKADPEHKGTLKLELVMLNNAPFAQPFPVLQLSLLDADQQVVARRRFQATEYLGSQAVTTSPMQPQETLSVEMALEDPGNVSGFRFDFL